MVLCYGSHYALPNIIDKSKLKKASFFLRDVSFATRFSIQSYGYVLKYETNQISKS